MTIPGNFINPNDIPRDSIHPSGPPQTGRVDNQNTTEPKTNVVANYIFPELTESQIDKDLEELLPQVSSPPGEPLKETVKTIVDLPANEVISEPFNREVKSDREFCRDLEDIFSEFSESNEASFNEASFYDTMDTSFDEQMSLDELVTSLGSESDSESDCASFEPDDSTDFDPDTSFVSYSRDDLHRDMDLQEPIKNPPNADREVTAKHNDPSQEAPQADEHATAPQGAPEAEAQATAPEATSSSSSTQIDPARLTLLQKFHELTNKLENVLKDKHASQEHKNTCRQILEELKTNLEGVKVKLNDKNNIFEILSGSLISEVAKINEDILREVAQINVDLLGGLLRSVDTKIDSFKAAEKRETERMIGVATKIKYNSACTSLLNEMKTVLATSNDEGKKIRSHGDSIKTKSSLFGSFRFGQSGTSRKTMARLLTDINLILTSNLASDDTKTLAKSVLSDIQGNVWGKAVLEKRPELKTVLTNLLTEQPVLHPNTTAPAPAEPAATSEAASAAPALEPAEPNPEEAPPLRTETERRERAGEMFDAAKSHAAEVKILSAEELLAGFNTQTEWLESLSAQNPRQIPSEQLEGLKETRKLLEDAMQTASQAERNVIAQQLTTLTKSVVPELEAKVLEAQTKAQNAKEAAENAKVAAEALSKKTMSEFDEILTEVDKLTDSKLKLIRREDGKITTDERKRIGKTGRSGDAKEIIDSILKKCEANSANPVLNDRIQLVHDKLLASEWGKKVIDRGDDLNLKARFEGLNSVLSITKEQKTNTSAPAAQQTSGLNSQDLDALQKNAADEFGLHDIDLVSESQAASTQSPTSNLENNFVSREFCHNFLLSYAFVVDKIAVPQGDDLPQVTETAPKGVQDSQKLFIYLAEALKSPTTTLLAKTNLMNMAREWIESPFINGGNVDAASAQIMHLCETAKSSGSPTLEKLAKSINDSVEAQTEVRATQHTDGTKDASAIFANIATGKIKMDSAEYRAAVRDFADSLTAMTVSSFEKLSAQEFARQAWAKDKTKANAPNLVGMTNTFNAISHFCLKQILGESAARNPQVGTSESQDKSGITAREARYDDMATQISFLMDVVDELLNSGSPGQPKTVDIHSAFALMGTLSDSSINRLRAEIDPRIDQNRLNRYVENCKLNSPEKSYSAQRQFQTNLGASSFVPYIGIYLSDLTFGDDGNDSMLKGQVNAAKTALLGSTLSILEEAQRHLKPSKNPAYRTADILNTKFSKEEAYQVSLSLKPRGQ